MATDPVVARALLSVSDKTGLADLARVLADLRADILSTGGTAKLLREKGIPHREVAEHTGFPEMLDGRVKTLHPKIHGGLLYRRDLPAHAAEAAKHGILPIDLVVVNLYPFRETVARPGVTREEAVEQIDIGGPSMVRSAAKNHAAVAVVVDPADYPEVIAALRAGGGRIPLALRERLAVKAYRHTALYDAAISAWLGGGPGFPDAILASGTKVLDLRYGENPHQAAAFYRTDEAAKASCVAGAEVLGGKALSYNNYLDLEAAYELVREFARPTAVIIKHNNPCGAASAETLVEAFRRALTGDPVSAFGGIAAFNRPLDAATAEAMAGPNTFFEAAIAPGVDPAAADLLETKPKWGKNLRLLKAAPLAPPPAGAPPRRDVRGLRGGFLVQTSNDAVLPAEPPRTATTEPTPDQRRDLLFAWTVCKHVKSNAIVLAKDETLVGVGAGQMSRVDSSELAVKKAGARAKGSVLASDAFFPFPDGLKAALDAGVVAAIHPGGSIRDKEVEALARERGIPLLITGMRHFRH